MYVIGKDEALRFASENCTSYKDKILDEIVKGPKSHWIYRLMPELKKAFEVEGVTEIVDVYTFNSVTEKRDANGNNIYYWEFGVMEPCVRHIETGVIGYPYQSPESKKKFGLMLMREDIAQGSTVYFSYTDEDRPNYVGTGSKKKMDDWFGFITRKNAAAQKYIDEARKKNKAFQEKVRAKFPNAWIHIVDDGWMSECEITHGYVVFRYEAGEDGRFYRSTKVDICNVPTTDELFGEEVVL